VKGLRRSPVIRLSVAFVLATLMLSLVGGTAIASASRKMNRGSSDRPTLATAPVRDPSIRPIHALTDTRASRVHRVAAPSADEPQTDRLHLVPNHGGPHGGQAAVDESTNWSGFIDTGTTFSGVEGQWTVPMVSSTGGDEYSASWIGIDGVSGSTLIQTGTEQDVVGGSTDYYAWVELLPVSQDPIEATVLPGDEMEAEIDETSANVWAITVVDVTQSWEFSNPFDYDTPGLSAEWIQEAPLVSGSQSTMAD
jgi:hypothetical protein